jgi:hypothetical protein
MLIALAAHPAGAGTVTGGAGFDYQTGPRAQSYRSALLFGTAEGGAGDLTLAAIRYSDSNVGPGIGAFANAGVALTPHVRVRAIGLRAIGDQAYRATRWRLGPELHMASDVTVGAYYLRLTDNAGGSFGSAGFEVGGPIGPGVTGQIGSSYGRWNGDATTAQAALSGTWHPVSRVLLLGELDVGRNLTTTTTAGPSSGGLLGGLPLPGGLGKGHGGPGETRSSNDITEAGQIGIRFLIR